MDDSVRPGQAIVRGPRRGGATGAVRPSPVRRTFDNDFDDDDDDDDRGRSVRSRGRGRGAGMRGGRGGRGGRGRGRGRGDDMGPRRRQNTGSDDSESHPAGEDMEEGDLERVTSTDFLSDHFGYQFHDDNELENYAKLMDTAEEIRNSIEAVKTHAKEASRKNDDDLRLYASNLDSSVDDAIATALVRLENTRDQVMPPHVPQAQDLSQEYHGALGLVPTGSKGLGNVVEDGLRWLTGREANAWIHPRTLAKRIIDGELVKLTSNNEKKEVLRSLRELVLPRNQRGAVQSVTFEPLDRDARRELVATVVRGQYIDSNDQALTNDVLKNAARLTNGFYPAKAKATLLETIGSFLPQERPADGAKQKRELKK